VGGSPAAGIARIVSRGGLSAERLQRLEQFFCKNYIDTGKLPGIQMMVRRRGELALRSVMGVAGDAR
jgi:hypothetical protein